LNSNLGVYLPRSYGPINQNLTDYWIEISTNNIVDFSSGCQTQEIFQEEMVGIKNFHAERSQLGNGEQDSKISNSCIKAHKRIEINRGMSFGFFDTNVF